MNRRTFAGIILSVLSCIGAWVLWEFGQEAQRISYHCALQTIATAATTIYVVLAVVFLIGTISLLRDARSWGASRLGLSPLVLVMIIWFALPLAAGSFVIYSGSLLRNIWSVPVGSPLAQQRVAQAANLLGRIFGQDGYAYVYEAYGEGNFSRHNYGEAERSYMQVLEHSRKPVDKEDWRQLHAMQRLGQIYLDQRRFHHAIEISSPVLQMYRRWDSSELDRLPDWLKDERNSQEAIVLEVTASAYFQLGEYDKALPLLNQEATIEETLYGRYHSVHTLETMADAFCSLHQFAAAERYARQAVNIREANMKDAIEAQQRPIVERDALAASYDRLAKILHNLGRDAEAQKYELSKP